MAGRKTSLASSVFFMAEAKPVQPLANRLAMDGYAMNCRHLDHDLVQRRIALLRQPPPQPGGKGASLPAARLPCGLAARPLLSRLRITMSFVQRGDTRKCRAAA